MKKILIGLMLVCLMVHPLFAWEITDSDNLVLFDSNQIVVLSVNASDTTEHRSQVLWIDTTYLPNQYGRAWSGMWDQIYVSYGASAIDTSADYSDVASVGDDFTGVIANDSGHVGLTLQLSADDGDSWVTVWRDTTIRAVQDTDTTDEVVLFPTMHDFTSAMRHGILYRVMAEVFRDHDSAAQWYPITDSVWLDEFRLYGYKYEMTEDWTYVDIVDSGTVLTYADDSQGDGNVRDSTISKTVRLHFVPEILRCEYGVSYIDVSCSLRIDNDSGAPFWTLQTRDNIDQPWRSWTLDSMHNVRDSFFNLTNDFADQDDTVWGPLLRVIEQFEMDCDSAGGTSQTDTIIFNGFRIYYYRNVR